MNTTQTTIQSANLETLLGRARGCLLGQLAGDSLGSLVEFKTPERIRELYPNGECDSSVLHRLGALKAF